MMNQFKYLIFLLFSFQFAIVSCVTTRVSYEDGITIDEEIDTLINECVKSIHSLGFGVTNGYQASDDRYIIEFARVETSQYAGQFRRAQGSEIILSARENGIHIYLEEFNRPSTERQTYRQDYARQFYNNIRNRFESSIVHPN
jgi:hypothetical protein